MKSAGRYTANMTDEEFDGAEPIPFDPQRERILEAAAELIAEGGRDAATTRAVAAAAGVQPPTLYRLFGDKRGLFDAVIEHVLADYLAEWGDRPPHPDPVRDLREGWDLHTRFGLAHPELFALMTTDPPSQPASSGLAASLEELRRRVRRLARVGRLRLREERAVALLQAAGTGAVLTLLSQPESDRDPHLAALARDAVVAAITGQAPPLPRDESARTAAAALRARLADTQVLSPGERHLLGELLDRIASG